MLLTNSAPAVASADHYAGERLMSYRNHQRSLNKIRARVRHTIHTIVRVERSPTGQYGTALVQDAERVLMSVQRVPDHVAKLLLKNPKGVFYFSASLPVEDDDWTLGSWAKPDVPF